MPEKWNKQSYTITHTDSRHARGALIRFSETVQDVIDFADQKPQFEQRCVIKRRGVVVAQKIEGVWTIEDES